MATGGGAGGGGAAAEPAWARVPPPVWSEHILSRLDAAGVCAAACACRALRAAAGADSVWRALAERRWAGKQQSLASERARRPGESWRQAYLREEREAHRRSITVEELCARRWAFRFRCDHEKLWSEPDAGGAAHELGVEPAARAGPTCDFSPEGHFKSTVRGAPSQRRPLAWQLVPAPPPSGAGWERGAGAGAAGMAEDTGAGADGASAVRVGGYPPLKVERSLDWGWRLENSFVIIESLGASTAAAAAC